MGDLTARGSLVEFKKVGRKEEREGNDKQRQAARRLLAL
jgi:hypothetical protein